MPLCGDHSDKPVHEHVLQIHETVETINQLKTNREFFLSFARQPQEFLNNWLISQTRDLKVGPNEEVGEEGGTKIKFSSTCGHQQLEAGSDSVNQVGREGRGRCISEVAEDDGDPAVG